MMRTSTVSVKNVLIILLVVLLVSACTPTANNSNPTALPTFTLPPEATVTATLAPEPTQPLEDEIEQGLPVVTMDLAGIAQSTGSLQIEAVPSTPDQPWWVAMPQYILMPLIGYPITGHSKDPQVSVYPVKDLSTNETAGKMAESLRTLLQNKQAGGDLPLLPLSSDVQMMDAQVKFLDFKNGTGVRFLTQLGNGLGPINNHDLFYTYQGLTNNGEYYLSVVLPVNLIGLPAYPTEIEKLPLEYTSDYSTYVASIVNQLNLEPDSAYTPDLSKLDALVQSLEVK